MRILYDTNVLVAMLSRREAILTFKKLIRQGGVTHISSAHIVSEVEAVLTEKLKLTRQKAKAAARLLERQSVIVALKELRRYAAIRLTIMCWLRRSAAELITW